MTSASELSVGFLASEFPRDPVKVNIYLEHVLIGQVIEPLFTLGDDGLIKGGVAEKWEFNSKNDELTILIKKIKFSNGKKIHADDIKFSLERHTKNPASQSYNYLQVIKEILVINSNKLKIILKNSYVPILLALSRDQLGILPKDWSFNSQNIEPFIGTGPYRIIKESNNWMIIANSNYRDYKEIKIKKWKLDILDPQNKLFPTSPSDLLILIPNQTKDLIKKRYFNFSTTREEIKAISFFQTSFWWVNNSYNSFTQDEREYIRTVLSYISNEVGKHLDGGLSTGVIPNGILGSLNERPTFENKTIIKNLNVQIAVPNNLAELLSEQLKKIDMSKFDKIKFTVNSFPIHEIKNVKNTKNHLVLISFAGGFFDPEGYLTVLPSMLGESTNHLFGQKAENIRLSAISQFDGKKRADLYRNFSQLTQEEVRYIPGWYPSFTEYRIFKIGKKDTSFNYSYKLIDYFEINSKGGTKDGN